MEKWVSTKAHSSRGGRHCYAIKWFSGTLWAGFAGVGMADCEQSQAEYSVLVLGHLVGRWAPIYQDGLYVSGDRLYLSPPRIEPFHSKNHVECLYA